MDDELLKKLQTVAARVFKGRGMLAAYAFGSRVSGRPLEDSDLDVGYYLEGYRRGELLPIREEMVLAADMSDEVGFQVDLRNLAGAPLELRGRVLEEGIRIYSGNDSNRVDLECEILARYHDYKDVFRQMHEIRLKETAKRGL